MTAAALVCRSAALRAVEGLGACELLLGSMSVLSDGYWREYSTSTWPPEGLLDGGREGLRVARSRALGLFARGSGDGGGDLEAKAEARLKWGGGRAALIEGGEGTAAKERGDRPAALHRTLALPSLLFSQARARLQAHTRSRYRRRASIRA